MLGTQTGKDSVVPDIPNTASSLILSTPTTTNSVYSQPAFDEMYEPEGGVRKHYKGVNAFVAGLDACEREEYVATASTRMTEEGITFTLHGSEGPNALERTIPFDVIPRVIPRDEWDLLESGLKQRVKALNHFLHDVYHDQNILHDGIIPRRMVIGNRYFRPEMMRLEVPGQVYVTTSGIDLIRDPQGRYLVLEDNLRTPSGFSYLYKSRSIMTSLCPELYYDQPIADIEQSLNDFLTSLCSIAPTLKSNSVISLLTPGSYNSAYFEHTFLAQQMGIELVTGNDLVCQDQKVYIRGMHGLRQVDVIYRRIDDDYLDPVAFRPDSLLGVPGLMNAYRAGNVAIANAPGTGVADDKAIYSFVPQMIRYYLNEDPVLHNVPTFILSDPEQLDFVLPRLAEMVIKETSLSGGYGMLIGPTATEEEIIQFRSRILEAPHRYIAQPTIHLSVASVMAEHGIYSRHIDLRAFVLMTDAQSLHVIPGGLTRVAMREGSLVVNSSQGGGCKDTWVLRDH